MLRKRTSWTIRSPHRRLVSVDGRQLVGAALVAGLVLFMVGAVRWRLSYEKPPAESLPFIHRDRARRRWIHVWMLAAMLVTPAAVAGFGTLPATGSGRAFAAMAATGYAIGAAGWVMSLTFRLTVVPWAAERTVSTGSVPDVFPAFDAWAGSLYVLHMAVSYASFALLGAAVLGSDVAPAWIGWLGIGWGIVFLAGFAATRFSGPFNPPFWAHLYPATLGVVLLATG